VFDIKLLLLSRLLLELFSSRFKKYWTIFDVNLGGQLLGSFIVRKLHKSFPQESAKETRFLDEDDREEDDEDEDNDVDREETDSVEEFDNDELTTDSDDCCIELAQLGDPNKLIDES